MKQAQKKSGSLRFWVGRSYFLGRFWGKNGLIWGCFRSAALPLRLCGSVWAVLGDALRALYLPSVPPLVVQGVGVPPAIKAPQNSAKRAQEEQRKSRSRYCVPSAANNKAVNGQTVNGSISFCFLA